jgi:membrane-associated protease RseP (regulator of RpoE activity)
MLRMVANIYTNRDTAALGRPIDMFSLAISKYQDMFRRTTMNQRGIFSFLGLCGVLLIILASCSGNPASSTDTSETSIAFVSMPAPVLGIVIDQDNTVKYVEPGSSAEQAGISQGDILQTVNGLSINSDREKVRKIIREAGKDQILSIHLKRKGNDIVIQVKPAPPTPKLGMATPTPVFPPFDYL